ncbi:MAG: hypothetical protein IPM42_04585 [Saprospiraceae bacterium]|nr:hypothetical protein [Saprospiraceae bacterium]
MSRYAVIDLGSNTFHLLIVEVFEDNTWVEVYRSRRFTGLSDGGIETLKDESISRSFDALLDFMHQIRYFHVQELRIIGTAALRTAENKNDFIQVAEKITNHKIEIISGLQEAKFIFDGIMLQPKARQGKQFIVDIGGGSTEFILTENGKMLHSESFKLGIGVLAELFHHHEPISEEELTGMNLYITDMMSDFIKKIDYHKPEILTGASGSFEILELLSGKESKYGETNEVTTAEFLKVYHKIVSANLKERLQMKHLPKERAKLSPVGLALMYNVIRVSKVEKILISSYAMKEGILSEMIALTQSSK